MIEEWLQLERDPSEVPELKCLCGIPACCRTARNERNHMRRFLHCDVSSSFCLGFCTICLAGFFIANVALGLASALWKSCFRVLLG